MYPAALQEAAVFAAQRFCSHETYGGDPTKARAAFSKQHSSFPARSVSNAFDDAIALFRHITTVVAGHLNECMECYKQNPKAPDFTLVAASTAAAFPKFSARRVHFAFSWVFYWHHLR